MTTKTVTPVVAEGATATLTRPMQDLGGGKQYVIVEAVQEKFPAQADFAKILRDPEGKYGGPLDAEVSIFQTDAVIKNVLGGQTNAVPDVLVLDLDLLGGKGGQLNLPAETKVAFYSRGIQDPDKAQTMNAVPIQQRLGCAWNCQDEHGLKSVREMVERGLKNKEKA
ncbi:MAG: hypothetical protein GF416_08440 [Candidatus Altiarchaeales archaeon]|nr:hypothetical protein [Candidatus Altiarchaeales archaeon]MBD3417143.1 hypothetical protein [Candidatus Altiarchaeales archaeon]